MAQHHKLTQTINLKNLIAMKKLISFVLLALAFSSCDKLEADLHEAQFVDISVNTFTMEQEPLQSKSRISASESEATQIAIAIFDSADEKVYSATQSASDTNITFGSFTGIRLYKGNYKIVIVAHKAAENGTAATITSPTVATINQTQINEIYTNVKSISVDPDNGSEQNVQISLPLCVTKLIFRIKDKIPNNVASAAITINEGQLPAATITLNPTTGLLSSNSSFTRVVDLTPYVGTGPYISVWACLNQYPKTCNIKIAFKDAINNVIYSHTYNNLEFNGGHVLHVGAYVFTQKSSLSLDFGEWVDNNSEIQL